MLHPSQFSLNEVWILFRLNNSPVCTEENGDFHVVCLMDAASCYILGTELFSVESASVPEAVAAKLMEAAVNQSNVVPGQIYISSTLPAEDAQPLLAESAIKVSIIPDNELLPFLSEAREGFLEHVGGGRVQ
ncbi:MAG: hypothetical protein AAGI88_13765 [Pseudomonadota bacterium]